VPACPRCRAQHHRDVELAQGFGALLEDVCPSCRGRLLPPAAVERVVVEELGLSAELLREMTALFASKARLPCPSCASKLSPLELRKVRIDLCMGCGSAWLDAGELARLGEGRHPELSPSPAATPAPVVVGTLVPDAGAPIEPSRFVVFFDEPASVSRAALAAAFTTMPIFAAPDAALIVARQRCTVIEGVTHEHALQVIAALAKEGIHAHVADDSWLSLPPALPTSALAVEGRGIILGSAAEAVGRVEVPWSSLAAMAMGQIVRSSLQRISSLTPAERETEMEHAIIETTDVCVEIVLRSPPRRYRLMLSTMIFGESGRPRRTLLDERLAALVHSASAHQLAVGRGVHSAIEGRPLATYASMKDLERELGWLLWRSFGGADGRAPSIPP
jgi:Zn-finger nucleic acid-binding protein